MPHITIKSFPKNLTETEAEALCNDITSIIQKHLGSPEKAISIDFQTVEPESWKSVVESDIKPRLEKLLKKPGYPV